MVILKSILLGLLQGVTEFLPISSSGHLVIVQSLLHVNYPGISFEVFVHTATLFAILLVFKKRVISIFLSVLSLNKKSRKKDLHYICLILVATVPSAVVGFFFRDRVKEMFTKPGVVGIALLVTGSYLFITRFVHPKRRGLGFWDAVIIGVSQSVALLPGISRSGITISTALLLGFGNEEAAEFCFLLAVPAILGATILEMGSLSASAHGIQFFVYIVGFLSAFFSGLLAIKLVIKTLRMQKFGIFAYYCWTVGAVIVLSPLH